MPRPKKSRRGGKRPGAGAPKGNLNALKHGRRSRQFAEIGAVFAASPAMREALLQLAERQAMKQLSADEIAIKVLNNMIARAVEIAHRIEGKTAAKPGQRANVRSSGLFPIDDGHTTSENHPSAVPTRHENPPQNEKLLPHNQTSDTNPS